MTETVRIEAIGRLLTNPAESTTKDGRLTSRVGLEVSVPRGEGEVDGEPVSVVVLARAYGDAAKALASHGKGDTVRVAGRARAGKVQPEGDEPGTIWECIADSVESFSLRH